MPDLDVSPTLTSSMLVDDFVVERRPYRVDTAGRVMDTVPTIFHTFGVVQAVSPDDLTRGSDEQHMQKTISIATQFRLQGPAPGFQPDVVGWHGSRYQVSNVGDFAQFGEGFTIVTAQSIDSVDPGPP